MKRNKRKRSPKKKSLGKFKSAIEKYCSDKLRESGLKFTYEETQFTLMDSFRFTNKYFKMTAKGKEMADRTGSVVLPITYKPDFVGKDHNWIIETGTANTHFFHGAIFHHDTDADSSGGALNVIAHGNGSSNDVITLTTGYCADIWIHARSTTVWNVWGHSAGATPITIADS